LSQITAKAHQVRCLVLDLDGVLTDNGIYINEDKKESRRFNIQDGFGIKLLKALGFEVAIITGSGSALIEHRMEQLGIEHYYTKHIHKLSAYEDLKAKLNLLDHEIAYMGDDYQDIVLLKRVGLSFAPANAIDAVKNVVDICTKASGGQGAVREVCEFFFQLHQKTQDIINYFEQYPCHTLEKVY
jgi:3-deoxy-D-manno-octulosonate 8-phosphate phosphatase (KDO 8-P phosphatase)